MTEILLHYTRLESISHILRCKQIRFRQTEQLHFLFIGFYCGEESGTGCCSNPELHNLRIYLQKMFIDVCCLLFQPMFINNCNDFTCFLSVTAVDKSYSFQSTHTQATKWSKSKPRQLSLFYGILMGNFHCTLVKLGFIVTKMDNFTVKYT